MNSIDLLVTDSAYRCLSEQQIKNCTDRFMRGDFGFEQADEIEIAMINAFAKCFDSPQHELSAFGFYPIKEGIHCYVVFDKAYCDKLGYDCLIIALNTDISLLHMDPLQSIINAVSANNTKKHWRG